jgi:putative redox protein
MGKTVVEFVEGMKFIGHGNSGHQVMMDSAPASGGSDSAARPVEALLASLGGCTGMDIVSILRKMKTEPKSLKIEIEDERATEYPKVFTKLHLSYYVTGEVPEANLKKAIDLSLAKYCPIANTLAGIAEITSSYLIEP